MGFRTLGARCHRARPCVDGSTGHCRSAAFSASLAVCSVTARGEASGARVRYHDASTGARRALSCRSRRGASFGDSDGSCWSSSDCAQPLQLLPGRRRAGRPFSGDHSAHTCSDSWQQIGAGQLTRRSALALRRSETSARSCAGPRGGGGTAGQNSERIEEKMVEAAGVGSAPILKFLKNLEKPKRSIGENWLNDIGREGAAQNRERPTARASQRRKSLVEKVEELKKRQKK